MLVHVFGKQDSDSVLLLLFLLVLVDLNFLLLPCFLHQGFGVHNIIACLEYYSFRNLHDGLYYYLNLVNVTSSQR